MTTETLSALVAFAFVTSITPGPNNLMLMASGANFGFRRTIPHMLGISLGHALMIVLVGLGLMQLFEAFPWIETALLAVSVAYLLWLAWKIANAAPPERREGTEAGRPLTFVQAALFQWVNPKAWAMALGAITLYAPSRSGIAVALVAATFCAVNLPSVSVWTVLGQQLRRILTRPRHLRLFNIAMAVLLVASVAAVLVPMG